MSVVLFDTHAFIKRLTAAGMPEPQAEVLADEHARLIDEKLASKADIASLADKLEPLATKAELRETELRLEAKIESFKSDTLKWAFGAIGFQTLVLLGATVALVKALH